MFVVDATGRDAAAKRRSTRRDNVPPAAGPWCKILHYLCGVLCLYTSPMHTLASPSCCIHMMEQHRRGYGAASSAHHDELGTACRDSHDKKMSCRPHSFARPTLHTPRRMITNNNVFSFYARKAKQNVIRVLGRRVFVLQQ